MARRKNEPFDRDAWITKYMRRALAKMWLWYPPRKEFKDAAEGVDGLYGCIQCAGRFPRSYVEVDHIVPAIPVEAVGMSWDEKINGRLDYPTNWRIVCKGCHKAKTKRENEKRREYKVPRNRKKVPGEV